MSIFSRQNKKIWINISRKAKNTRLREAKRLKTSKSKGEILASIRDRKRKSSWRGEKKSSRRLQKGTKQE